MVFQLRRSGVFKSIPIFRPKREYYAPSDKMEGGGHSPPEPEYDYVTDEALPSMVDHSSMRKRSNEDDMLDGVHKDEYSNGPSGEKYRKYDDEQQDDMYANYWSFLFSEAVTLEYVL